MVARKTVGLPLSSLSDILTNCGNKVYNNHTLGLRGILRLRVRAPPEASCCVKQFLFFFLCFLRSLVIFTYSQLFYMERGGLQQLLCPSNSSGYIGYN